MQELSGIFEGKRPRDRWDDGRENNIKTDIEETGLENAWKFNIYRLRTGWTILCLNSRQHMWLFLLVNHPDHFQDPPSFLLNTYGV
jgi:hypothetical protein